MVASFKASERWKDGAGLGRFNRWFWIGSGSKGTELDHSPLENTRSESTQLDGTQLDGTQELSASSEDIWQVPTWGEVVTLLGQEIKALRESQSLTLEQIHAQTKVPLYHLRALETGALQGLPEPVFVRGFLTRICQALGEDGPALLAKLPDLEPVSIHLSTQLTPSSQSGMQFGLNHLYLTYGVLLTGAVGGLAWVGQNELNPTSAPSADGGRVSLRAVSSRTASSQVILSGIVTSSGISLPQGMQPEFMSSELSV